MAVPKEAEERGADVGSDELKTKFNAETSTRGTQAALLGPSLKPLLFAMGLLRCALAFDARGLVLLGCLGAWTDLEASILFLGFAGAMCPSIVPDLVVLSVASPSVEQQAHVLNGVGSWNILGGNGVSGAKTDTGRAKGPHPATDLEKKPHPGKEAVCEGEGEKKAQKHKPARSETPTPGMAKI